MRATPQVLALVSLRPGLIFMVRMIVLSGARDGVRGGSVTLACMSGPSPPRQQLSGAQITVPAGPRPPTADPRPTAGAASAGAASAGAASAGAASAGILAVQV